MDLRSSNKSNSEKQNVQGKDKELYLSQRDKTKGAGISPQIR